MTVDNACNAGTTCCASRDILNNKSHFHFVLTRSRLSSIDERHKHFQLIAQCSRGSFCEIISKPPVSIIQSTRLRCERKSCSSASQVSPAQWLNDNSSSGAETSPRREINLISSSSVYRVETLLHGKIKSARDYILVVGFWVWPKRPVMGSMLEF